MNSKCKKDSNQLHCAKNIWILSEGTMQILTFLWGHRCFISLNPHLLINIFYEKKMTTSYLFPPYFASMKVKKSLQVCENKPLTVWILFFTRSFKMCVRALEYHSIHICNLYEMDITDKRPRPEKKLNITKSVLFFRRAPWIQFKWQWFNVLSVRSFVHFFLLFWTKKDPWIFIYRTLCSSIYAFVFVFTFNRIRFIPLTMIWMRQTELREKLILKYVSSRVLILTWHCIHESITLRNGSK